MARFQQHIDLLNEKDGAGFGRIPPSWKRCKSPVEFTTLDDVFPSHEADDYIVHLRVPQGSTYRNALKHFHHAHSVFSESLHLCP